MTAIVTTSSGGTVGVMAVLHTWTQQLVYHPLVHCLVDRLARIAASYYPKPVIVRTSDFKTNEYANLIGGTAFEPKEENPMLGFRGASRY